MLRWVWAYHGRRDVSRWAGRITMGGAYHDGLCKITLGGECKYNCAETADGMNGKMLLLSFRFSQPDVTNGELVMVT